MDRDQPAAGHAGTSEVMHSSAIGCAGPNSTKLRAVTRPRLRGVVTLAISAALLVVLAWGSGLTRFAAAIPTAVEDTETRTDAIVVLTGGSERLATGVSLLGRGLAERAFVSGVHPDVDARAMLGAAGAAPPEPIDRIDTGRGARDTAGNARETAAWIRAHGYRSLRLVTASYHMPRSLLEFGRALPEATIVPHPVFPSHVRQARWWLWPGTAGLIIGEYNKFLWSWLRLEIVAAPAQAPAGGRT